MSFYEDLKRKRCILVSSAINMVDSCFIPNSIQKHKQNFNLFVYMAVSRFTTEF